MSEQISIFSNPSDEDSEMYEVYEKMRLEAIKSKRIRFKNPTYTKFYKEDKHIDGSETKTAEKYGEMNRLYTELSNRFPFPLHYEENYKEINSFDNGTFYIDTGIIRTYKLHYTKEKYTHKGDDGIVKEYKGEEFDLYFAEIIGTEDFGINERLFIHSELIRYLDEGYKIEKLNMWLDELINFFSSGWSAELLIVLLLNKRCGDAI